jgi:hypothetical protein
MNRKGCTIDVDGTPLQSQNEEGRDTADVD